METGKKQIAVEHLKTHTERSAEDRAAVSVLETFLRSNGKVNPHFSVDDKWPNTDGTFEFVRNPMDSRRPAQNFVVQIKGTTQYTEHDGEISYSLKSLAFPAVAYCNVTFDPCILFVVLNPCARGKERVFFKYMSANYLNSIDFDQESATVHFSKNEEIENADNSVETFCRQLNEIIDRHRFVMQLNEFDYTRRDIEKIILSCDNQISECIDYMDVYNETRDNISKKILSRLEDLCTATLLMNSIAHDQSVRIFAWRGNNPC